MPGYALFILEWLAWLARRFAPTGRVPGWVVFTLDGEYADYPRPAAHPLLRLFQPRRPSLLELRDQFRAVARDPRVHGVVLQLRPLALPGAQIETLRDAILELRGSGKRVVAWSFLYTRTNYYVAAAADEVLLQPGGYVEPLGAGASYVFMGDALARIGLRAEVLPITHYKSAMDMFASNAMSDEAREMANWLLDAEVAERVGAIAQGRDVDEAGARALIDATPCTDLRALELRLIDGIVTAEELPRHLGTAAGAEDLEPFEAVRRRLAPRRPALAGRHVAIIPIEGTILDGESGRPPVAPPIPIPIVFSPRAGDITVVRAARQATRDDRVGAVVVYVNSPGGSPYASEAIHAALQHLNLAKPVVVAMGPLAASGGYYVAMPARRIFSQPSTITGSIGVVFAKFVARDLLDRLSLRRETLHRGEHTLMESVERPYTEEERAIAWERVQRTYEIFLDRVSAARKIPKDRLDPIAGGRVWTGRQALERGLVDELGGLPAAIACARGLAGLGDGAPVRVTAPGKAALAPAAPAASAIRYAFESLAVVAGGAPLYLCPLIMDEG